MKRTAVVLAGVVCAVIVAAELVGIGLLWFRGRLNSDVAGEIASILSGEADTEAAVDLEPEANAPSRDDVVEMRVTRAFDIGVREAEVELLNELVAQKRAALLAELNLFENQKQEFEMRLAEMREQLASEAAEQVRGVLAGLSTEDAVDYLLGLELSQNVLLLKGMPPKEIGRILKEFNSPEAPAEARQRGADIFKALSQASPQQEIVDETLTDLSM